MHGFIHAQAFDVWPLEHLALLARQQPQTRVLLLGILPRGPDAFDPFRPVIAETNANLARLADGARVRYLDIGSRFLLSDGSLSPAVMADYLHPTLLGYQIYASSIWTPLNNLLSEPPPTARPPARRQSSAPAD